MCVDDLSRAAVVEALGAPGEHGEMAVPVWRGPITCSNPCIGPRLRPIPSSQD
jgi:hypothetical protein